MLVRARCLYVRLKTRRAHKTGDTRKPGLTGGFFEPLLSVCDVSEETVFEKGSVICLDRASGGGHCRIRHLQLDPFVMQQFSPSVGHTGYIDDEVV